MLVVILTVLYYIYSQGVKKGTESQENTNNKQIIQTKDIVIKEYEKAKIRKVKNKLISSDNNIEWLRQKRCSDCNSQ